MHWLYLIASLICMVVAMNHRTPTWAVVLLILLALGLVLAWMLGWLATRLSGVRRDDVQMIAPEEIRRLREQAEARRNQASSSGEEG